MLSMTEIIGIMILAVLWQVLNHYDYEITKDIIANGGYEKNKLIGKYPSERRLNNFKYISAVAYTILVIFCILNSQAQIILPVFVVISTSLKLYMVLRNTKILKDLKRRGL
jgi:hypothetical protein